MNPRTRELKQRLDEEKAQLRTTLHAIGEKASAAVDWRARFNDNPMGMLGAAVAAGALVGAITAGRIGGRREEFDDDEDDFEEEPVRRPVRSRRQAGAWSHVRSTIGSLAAQQAVIFAERLAASLVAGAAGRSRRSRSNGESDH